MNVGLLVFTYLSVFVLLKTGYVLLNSDTNMQLLIPQQITVALISVNNFQSSI